MPGAAQAMDFAPAPAGPLTWPSPDAVVNGFVAADVGGNGNADIVSIGQSNKIQVSLANDEGTAFTPAPGSPFGSGADDVERHQVVAGEFGGDGAVDLVTVGTSPRKIETYIGDGTGTYADTPDSMLIAPETPDDGVIDTSTPPAVGRLNGDEYPDLVIGMEDHAYMVALGSASGQFTVTPQSDDGAVLPSEENSVGDTYASPTLGDLNGDGKLDVAFVLRSPTEGEASSPGVYVAYGNGDGTFTPAANNPAFQSDAPLGTVARINLNGDAYADLSLTDPSYGEVITLLGGTTGPVEGESVSVVDPVAQAIGDLDQDGDEDIATGLVPVSYTHLTLPTNREV